MIIPKIHNNSKHTGFTIFTACDNTYFEEFGNALISSVHHNTNYGVHLHIYNPSHATLESVKHLSHSYEFISPSELIPAAEYWDDPQLDEFNQHRLLRIRKAMEKGGDSTILERILKTYYACVRFIRLCEIYTGTPIFAIDIDALVRSEFPQLCNSKDFYIHKNSQYLAGGIYLTNQSHDFILNYSNSIESHLLANYLYWSLDQDILDSIVPNYNFGELPRSYIDWNMNQNSYIWTAKGKRKDLEIFKSEKLKYDRE